MTDDGTAARRAGRAGCPPRARGRPSSAAGSRVPESAARGGAALRRRPGRRARRARAGPLRRRPDPPVHPRRGGPGPRRAARLGRRVVREHRPRRLRAAGSPVAAVLPGRPGADPRAGLAPRPGRRPRAWCCWPTWRRWRRPPCSSSWCAARPATRRRGPPVAVDPQPAARRLRPRDGLRRVAPAGLRHRLLPRPAPARRATARPGPHFALAGGARVRRRAHAAHRRAAGAGRGWPSSCAGGRAWGAPSAWRASARVAAPFVGVLAFLAWAKHEVGDWWAPLRVQLQSSHHGGLSDPLRPRCTTTPRGWCTTTSARRCTCPWVLLALAMLIVCWRRLPAPYTLFAAAVLATRGGREQPRFVRALRPERLPAVDRRRARADRDPTRADRPGAALAPGWPGTPCWPSSTSRCPDDRRRRAPCGRLDWARRTAPASLSTDGGSTNLPFSMAASRRSTRRHRRRGSRRPDGGLPADQTGGAPARPRGRRRRRRHQPHRRARRLALRPGRTPLLHQGATRSRPSGTRSCPRATSCCAPA